jgi:hypothetical protein
MNEAMDVDKMEFFAKEGEDEEAEGRWRSIPRRTTLSIELPVT